MKYYANEERLGLAREDGGLFYRYDWLTGNWLRDNAMFGNVAMCSEWYDEVTDEEIEEAIKNRTKPIATNPDYSPRKRGYFQ